MLALRLRDHRRELGVHRDRENDTGLLVLKVNGAVADMLPAETDDIGPALRGVEQQCEREPGSRSDWVYGFKFGDFVFGPCPIARRLCPRHLDPLRWIVTGGFFADRGV